MFCTVALVVLEFKILLHVQKYIEELNLKIPSKTFGYTNMLKFTANGGRQEVAKPEKRYILYFQIRYSRNHCKKSMI